MEEQVIKGLRIRKIIYFNIGIVILYLIYSILSYYGVQRFFFLFLGVAALIMHIKSKQSIQPFNLYNNIFPSLKPLDDYEKGKMNLDYKEIQNNRAKVAPFIIILMIIQFITQGNQRWSFEDILYIFTPMTIIAMIATTIGIIYLGKRIDNGKGRSFYEYSKKNIILGCIFGLLAAEVIFGVVILITM